MDYRDDQQVISVVLDGDADAYAALVERYQTPIFNLMYRMTRSVPDAVDLTQETFIRAYEQLTRFRRKERFFPWLYTIGLNQARNFLRRSKASRTISLEDCDPGSGLDYPGQQEENMCARLDSRRVRKALDQLPCDYREAVILRYHEDLSMEDIATALDLSVSGAKMRVHRGIQKLRDLLESDNHEKE